MKTMKFIYTKTDLLARLNTAILDCEIALKYQKAKFKSSEEIAALKSFQKVVLDCKKDFTNFKYFRVDNMSAEEFNRCYKDLCTKSVHWQTFVKNFA